MQRTQNRRIAVSAGIVVLGGTAAFAHHLCQPLSSVLGPNILSSVPFHTQSSNFGVPPHRVSTEEFGHHQTLALQDGAGFTIEDGLGNLETITFTAADFPDITNAEVEEVLEVISNRSALVDGGYENGYLVLRGAQGGQSAEVRLTDGFGGPLALLELEEGSTFGSDAVTLDVSIPLPACGHPHPPSQPVAGFPYIIFASTTPTPTIYRGEEFPVQFGQVTRDLLRGASTGLLPGFTGFLDANEDATATIPGWVLESYFQGQYPDALYLVFAVWTPDFSKVEFVSNAFVIDFQ